MDIKKEDAKLRKRIENLNWQLTSSLALSQKQRKVKEEEFVDLKQKLIYNRN